MDDVENPNVEQPLSVRRGKARHLLVAIFAVPADSDDRPRDVALRFCAMVVRIALEKCPCKSTRCGVMQHTADQLETLAM
jgi:hypothetical protein